MQPISHYQVSNDRPAIRLTINRAPGTFPTRSVVVGEGKVYDLTVVCETCAFLFEKVGYEYKLSPEEVGARLRAGTTLDDPALLDAVAALLPADDYGVVSTRFVPTLTGPGEPDDYFSHESVAFFGLDPTWGVPDTPRVRYWRAGSSTLPIGIAGHRRLNEAGDPIAPSPERFFHFVVPIEPPHIVHRDRVDAYRAEMERGVVPAALAVGILDVRQKAVAAGDGADPALSDGVEWCLASFLLDGHHKMVAASEARRPIRLLLFLARYPSIAKEEEILAALRELAAWDHSGVSAG